MLCVHVLLEKQFPWHGVPDGGVGELMEIDFSFFLQMAYEQRRVTNEF